MRRQFIFSIIFFSILLFASVEEEKGLALQNVIESMLKYNVNISSSIENIKYQKASVMVQEGVFDPKLSIYTQYSRDKILYDNDILNVNTDLENNKDQSTEYGVLLDKQLKSGLEFTTGVKVIRYNTNKTEEYKSNTDRLYFTIAIPLMKNAGRENTLTGIEVSQKKLLETEYSLANTISKTSLQTINAYWNYLYSHKKYKLTCDIVMLTKELYNSTQALVKADFFPAVEAKQIRALLESKKLQKIKDENIMYENFKLIQNLSNIENVKALLPVPLNDFPNIINLDKRQVSVREKLYVIAKKNRYDLKMIEEKLAYTKILKKYQKNQMLPDLSLETGGNYDSIKYKSYSLINLTDSDAQQMSIQVKLKYEIPIGRNSSHGAYLQSLSNYNNFLLEKRNKELTIKTNLNSLVFVLRGYIRQLEVSKKVIKFYEESKRIEMKKVKLGVSTINNLIDVREKWIDARENHLNLLLGYAVKLTELRYESGLLIKKKGKNLFSITDIKDFHILN